MQRPRLGVGKNFAAPGAVRATSPGGRSGLPPPRLRRHPPRKHHRRRQKRSPAPSLAPSVTPDPARASSGPSVSTIQLDPELAAEVAAAMPYESTLITRNPLLDKTPPPVKQDDDATNPGARRPTRR